MRAMVVLAVLSLALPVAAAGSASLTLTPPEGPVPSGSVVPVAVRVEMRDFWCRQPREFGVEATLRGSAAEASLPNGTLRMMTDDAPHYGSTFTAEGTLHVAVRALGSGEGVVDLVATVSPPQDCFAPEGFTGSAANVTIRVLPEPQPAPDASGGSPATNESGVDSNESAAANESVDANGTQESTGVDRRAPPGSGPIGDYRPPESPRDAPGPGAALAVAAVAVAAVAWRSRRA